MLLIRDFYNIFDALQSESNYVVWQIFDIKVFIIFRLDVVHLQVPVISILFTEKNFSHKLIKNCCESRGDFMFLRPCKM